MSTVVNCPNCKKQVIWGPDAPYRPFCSKQCQLIDLGEWAAENHKIATQSGNDQKVTPDMIEDIEAMLAQAESEAGFFKE
ncbi:DNA gyrase inhibitor YacG [Pseudoalteromonas tunicata]|jgi:endogenous inhibitor of DNA gyrase (YacG/DUF329 family)|uniref:DNA gyrase inhibitor YacG n=1 Tax=Pseudoalteromonas tunicata D2 TaxID=87626 RepID=A4C8Y6_9GAMM|nr:DNA gyrase inhibitor YacG [Pseudoalteromonas tunicata]ATC93553.1 hypothetical protein PTUN_a0832 [Pseudoalteromonas tunicata]AXT29395.1 DNA gyrase inhibitor YacG [Pseudoalteromonas tunicata]EAR29051.1 hypothetical protein PTD2_08404 [Pseudoalteromonas tunicata D2]MDP4984133.1 DNA gyrase inhibitor YacG [Pseudoalteromonas tunicata]MDP5211770.1 DNA gyrase inhibitor YacG [Pseudoalteromonas tunicata]